VQTGEHTDRLLITAVFILIRSVLARHFKGHMFNEVTLEHRVEPEVKLWMKDALPEFQTKNLYSNAFVLLRNDQSRKFSVLIFSSVFIGFQE